jgi:hypothetical protein
MLLAARDIVVSLGLYRAPMPEGGLDHPSRQRQLRSRRSYPSGSVLIGVIPGSGDGKVGILSGNAFTPLPGSGVSALGSVW